MLDFLTPYFSTIAAAGDLAKLLAVLFWLALWCVLSRDRRGAFLLCTTTTALLTTVAAMKVTANFYGLPWRPHWETISNLFPSGHMAMSILIYGAGAICVYRANPFFGGLTALAVALYALALGLERVGSGAHPFLDVVGGTILGLGALILLSWLWPKRQLLLSGIPIVIGMSAISFYALGRWQMPTVRWIEWTSSLLGRS